MLDFLLLRNQNTKSIFVPLNGTQSELPDTIYKIFLSLFVVKLLILQYGVKKCPMTKNPVEISIFHHIGNSFVLC